MNKKGSLIVLVMGLLMLLAAMVPVMAAPATKVPASTTTISSITVLPPPEVKITPSGFVHIRGVHFINQRTLTIGATEYDVYVVGSYDGFANPTTGTAIIHFTAVWYVGSLTAPTSDGFSGNQESKVLDFNPVTETGGDTTAHLVLQGFGSFAQYTLKLDYEGPYEGAMNPSGYCIIP
jgi:hypothetical protein